MSVGLDLSTALTSLAGGVLIGGASLLLLAYDGRIAGISGIVGDLVPPRSEPGWRLAFLAGLVVGGLFLRLLGAELPTTLASRSWPTIVGAGLLVGFGTRLAGGCTSGHGVCGLGRASPRSLGAVLVFMATAIATVFVARHLLGGAP